MKQKRTDIVKELSRTIIMFNENCSEPKIVQEYVNLMNKDKHCIDVLGSQLIESAIGHIAGIIAVSSSIEMTKKYQDMLFVDILPIMLCELSTDWRKKDYTETHKRLSSLVRDYFGITTREDSYIDNCKFYMEKYLYDKEYWSTEKIRTTVTTELLNSVREHVLAIFQYVAEYVPHEHEFKHKDIQYLREELCNKFVVDTSHIVRKIDYPKFAY